MTKFCQRLCTAAVTLCLFFVQNATVCLAETSTTPAPVNLDLTSTSRSVAPANTSFSSANLMIGGTTQTVSPQSVLTPAEHLALQQILTTGQQSVILSANGNAIGGTFALTNQIAQQISHLVVPQGVTAVRDFGTQSNLNLSGNFTNGGNFYALSSNSAVTNAIISATNIFNQRGALLTSILPAGGIPGFTSAVDHLDLTLKATNKIVNEGIISSSGKLNLQTNVLINSGNISSANSDINIAQSGATDLTVDNRGGVIDALNGSINIGNKDLQKELVGTAVIGGDLLSKSVNINSGSGTAILNVNRMSGELNATAGALHTLVHNGDLRLGKICLEGDPTFFDLDGSVILSPDLVLTTNGAPLAILATADIITENDGNNPPIQIDTSSPNGGGDILMVAGANLSCASCAQFENNWSIIGGTGLPAPDITINGASSTGGRIYLTAGGGIDKLDSRGTSGNFRGGNITLIAYQDSGNEIFQSGTITLPDALTIRSGGSGIGTNGNVRIFAGQTSPSFVTGQPAIQIGNIDTTGGDDVGGQIYIVGDTPVMATYTIFEGANRIHPVSQLTVSNSALPADGIFSTRALTSNPLAGGDYYEGTSQIEQNSTPLPTGIVVGSLNATGSEGIIIRSGQNLIANGILQFTPNGHNRFVVTGIDLFAPTVSISGVLAPQVEFYTSAGVGGFTSSDFVTAGDITVKATGAGNIKFDGGVKATGVSGVFPVNSIGVRTETGDVTAATPLEADQVFITKDQGSIGSPNSRVLVKTNILGINAENGSAYITNTSPYTPGEALTLRSSATVSPVAGNVMDIDSLVGDIVIGETPANVVNLNGKTQIPQSEVRLTVHGNGNIKNGVSVVSGHVILTAENGDIGEPAFVLPAHGPIIISQGSTVDISTQGNAYIKFGKISDEVHHQPIPEPTTGTNLGIISVGNGKSLVINALYTDESELQFNITDLRLPATGTIGVGTGSSVKIITSDKLTLAGSINASGSTVDITAKNIIRTGHITATNGGQLNITTPGNSLTIEGSGTNQWSASTMNIDVPSGAFLFFGGTSQNFTAPELAINAAGATILVGGETTWNMNGNLFISTFTLNNAGAIKSTGDVFVTSGSGTGLRIGGGGLLAAGDGKQLTIQAFDNELIFTAPFGASVLHPAPSQFFNAFSTLFQAIGTNGAVIVDPGAIINVLDSTAKNNRMAITAPDGSSLNISANGGTDTLSSSGKIEISAPTGQFVTFGSGGTHKYTTLDHDNPEVILSGQGISVNSVVNYNKKIIVNTPSITAASKANLRPVGGTAPTYTTSPTGPSPASAGLQIKSPRFQNGGSVQLGGAVGGGPIQLENLDLTDPNATSMIKGLLLGGAIKATGFTVDASGRATGGTLTFGHNVDLSNLTGLFIPSKVTLILENFGTANPINVHLDAPNEIVGVFGTLQFTAANGFQPFLVNGVLTIDSTNAEKADTPLLIGSTAIVNSVGGLSMSAQGNIRFESSIKAAGLLRLSATGSISQIAKSTVNLTAPVINLSGVGNVGIPPASFSPVNPIQTATTCLIANSAFGSVFVNNTAPAAATLKVFGTSSSGSMFSLTNNTKISVDNPILSPGVTLAAKGGIDLKANIGSLAFSGTVTLDGGGGSITQVANKTINSRSFVNILGAKDVGTATAPIVMVTPLLKLVATGNANITNADPNGVQIVGATVGGTSGFQLTQTAGTIKANTAISAKAVSLTATAGDIGILNSEVLVNTGLLTLSGQNAFVKNSATTALSLAPSNLIGGLLVISNGGITVNGTLSAPVIELRTTTGNITTAKNATITAPTGLTLLTTTGSGGTGTAPLNIATADLIASSLVSGTPAFFITNSGAISVSANAVSRFQLNNSGGAVTLTNVLVLNGPINVQNINGTVNIAGTVAAAGIKGIVTITGGTAINTGEIKQTNPSGIVRGSVVNLNNGQLGDIGSSIAPIRVDTLDLNISTASPTNKVFIDNQNTGLLKVELAKPLVDTLSVTSAGSIVVEGSALAGSLLSLTTTGASSTITQAKNSIIAGATLNLSANQGAIELGQGVPNSGSLLFQNISVNSAGSVNIKDGISFTLNTSNVGGPFTLTTIGGGVTFAGTLTASNGVIIQSPTSLNISGSANISSAGVITFTALNGDLNISGAHTLDGDAVFNSNLGSTVVGDASTVHNTHNIIINSGSLFNPNAFSVDPGSTITFNASSSVSLGTIANANGDVILTSNMLINSGGKNLAILALGNVMAQPGVQAINLTGTTGPGGNLTILAGVDFTSNNGLYSISGKSNIGGSVNLNGVNISTNSNSTVAGKNNGGNIVIVANSGDNAGIIVTGSINTSSKNGMGGGVLLSGGGGVIVNGGTTGINTSGGLDAGSVTISGANLSNADAVISNGAISSVDAIDLAPVAAGAGAAISVIGPINTTSTTGHGGAVNLSASSAIQTNSITSGGRTDGGAVSLTSLDNAVLVIGDINTSFATPMPATFAGTAPSGGGIRIRVPFYATITGKLVTAGGDTMGSGNGGHAGTVDIQTSTNGNPLGMFQGNILIGSYIDASGGNAKVVTNSSARGGNGGEVTLTAGAVQVKGMLNGVSILASKGTNASATNTDGENGTVEISTFASQTFPTSLDLLSKSLSEAALAGGMFTVGTTAANPTVINGTAGSIVSGGGVLDKTNAATLVADKTSGPVTVHVTDALFRISEDGHNRDISASSLNASNVRVRTMVTPAEAIALYQVSAALDPSTAQTVGIQNGQLVSSSPNTAVSTISVSSRELPLQFRSFVLSAYDTPSGVSLQISGPQPILDLSKTTKPVIAGELKFLSAGLTGVNFGTNALDLPAGASITAPDTLLLIGGATNTWKNSGHINASDIVFAAPNGSITIQNTISGDLPANGEQGEIAIMSNAPTAIFSLVGQGNVAPIFFKSIQLPTAFGALASSAAPTTLPIKSITVNTSGSVLLNSALTAGSITISTTAGITISGRAQLSATTGDLKLLTSGNIDGIDIGARLSAKNGIELSAGSTTSQLAAAFAKPASTPSATILGANIVQGIKPGVVVLNTKNGSTGAAINLNTGTNQSTINLNGGRVVFDVSGQNNAATIQLEGVEFFTNPVPIAYQSNGAAFICADHDTVLQTKLGSLRIKKGAMVSLHVSSDSIRVIACSGPNHVRLVTRGLAIPVELAQEVVLSRHQLTQDECIPTDGIGRRRIQQNAVADGVNVTRSDVSLVSFLANTRGIPKACSDRILKTAAVIHQLTQNRGSYTARSKPRTQPLIYKTANAG